MQALHSWTSYKEQIEQCPFERIFHRLSICRLKKYSQSDPLAAQSCRIVSSIGINTYFDCIIRGWNDFGLRGI